MVSGWSRVGIRIHPQRELRHLVASRRGREPRRVTSSPRDDRKPAWSQDGEWSLFSRDRRLWRIPRAGGDPELLTEGSAWSPVSSRDDERVFLTGWGERASNLWALSLRRQRIPDHRFLGPSRQHRHRISGHRRRLPLFRVGREPRRHLGDERRPMNRDGSFRQIFAPDDLA
jgi:dipeptidyl aminopeptidase/acylaminoacyl peptidase